MCEILEGALKLPPQQIHQIIFRRMLKDGCLKKQAACEFKAYVEVIFFRELTPANQSADTLSVGELRPQMLLHMLLEVALLSKIFVSVSANKVFDSEMDSEMHH